MEDFPQNEVIKKDNRKKNILIIVSIAVVLLLTVFFMHHRRVIQQPQLSQQPTSVILHISPSTVPPANANDAIDQTISSIDDVLQNKMQPLDTQENQSLSH